MTEWGGGRDPTPIQHNNATKKSRFSSFFCSPLVSFSVPADNVYCKAQQAFSLPGKASQQAAPTPFFSKEAEGKYPPRTHPGPPPLPILILAQIPLFPWHSSVCIFSPPFSLRLDGATQVEIRERTLCSPLPRCVYVRLLRIRGEIGFEIRRNMETILG